MEEDLRERARRDHLRRLERDGPLDQVLQLADVPRPGVRLEEPHRLGRDLLLRHPLLAGHLPEKVPDEVRDVLAALAERRDRKGDDVDPVEEVLAEGPFLHLLPEVLVRRADDPHVDGLLGVPADAPDDALLKGAEELDLHRDGGLADLVEEERPPFGFLEEPLLLPDRPGEGAPSRDRTAPTREGSRASPRS